MADSRLFETMRTFSPEEQEAFVLFLKSPFFLREEAAGEMLELYAFARRLLAVDPDARPDKQSLHAAGFPGKPYSEGRLNRAMAHLGQLAKQFLLFNLSKEHPDDWQQNIQWAGIFRKRNERVLAEKHLQKADKISGQITEGSLQNYRLRYQLAYEKYEYIAINNPVHPDLNIPQTLQQLRLYYQAVCAELLNHLLMQRWAVPGQHQDMEQLVQTFGMQDDAFSTHYPLLKIFRKLQELLLRREVEIKDVYALMALIEEHEKGISADLVQQFYTYLRNYCAILADRGIPGMHEVLHKVLLDNLKRGYLYFKDNILPHALLNITRTGLIIKNYAVTREVLEAHRHRIFLENEQGDFYRINLAFCFFAEKEFETAAEHLAFPTNMFVYLLSARRLEVMIHYELQSDLLMYKIDAFRKFVERTPSSEISAGYRKQHLHFINIVLQLAHSKIKDHKRSLLILKRIEGTSPLAERIWLVEKAKSLA